MAETVPPGSERSQRKSNRDRTITTPTICNNRLHDEPEHRHLSSVGDPRVPLVATAAASAPHCLGGAAIRSC
jgi:hypothetical protein